MENSAVTRQTAMDRLQVPFFFLLRIRIASARYSFLWITYWPFYQVLIYALLNFLFWRTRTILWVYNLLRKDASKQSLMLLQMTFVDPSTELN